MAHHVVRTNPTALRWLRAAFLAASAFSALSAMAFYPAWAAGSLAITVFLLAMWTPAIALLFAVAALAVPVAASDFVVGALLAVSGFAAAQLLAPYDAAGGVALVLAVVCIPLGVGFAAPVLAGYLFGSRSGVPGALLACIFVIATGAILGTPTIGPIFTGGDPMHGVLAIATAPKDPLAFSWLSGAIADADPSRVLNAFTVARPVWPLVAQPLLWGALALAASTLRGSDRHTPERVRALAGLALLTLLGAGVSTAVLSSAGAQPGLASTGREAAASLAAVLIAGAFSEWVFPRVSVQIPRREASHTSLRTEEADVDELLRLIASAEEELASRHTRHAVVMLTDLKAFSQMTERLGSVECAKIVQRHRDVLLPIVQRHGGKGKPTGGDGLVAAFATAGDAVEAAIEMQQAVEHLGSMADLPEALAVRIGIASGEVVVDAGGRPFLGAALNLAARVMGLADGGRIFATGTVASDAHAPGVHTHSHGRFDLKNISHPVEIVEVFWKPGMKPQPIARDGLEE